MEVNGKFYLPPPKEELDVRQLFAYAVSQSAGQPVDELGLPKGQWTPESLANAISSIDHPDAHIELRSVQYWFQTDSTRNISLSSCKWLARIFGCEHPDYVVKWQKALMAGRSLHAQKRPGQTATPPIDPGTKEQVIGPVVNVRRGLLKTTEAMFASDSTLTLPLVIFTGACALALVAFTLNIHSVIFAPPAGPSRQVGFLWAPNWTIVFIAILPLFLAHMVELMRRWKTEWRPKLDAHLPARSKVRSWELGLNKSVWSFRITFFITVLIASLFNWITTHLLPFCLLYTSDAADD